MDVTNPSPSGEPARAVPLRPGALGALTRRDPSVRRVALAWRRLTSGGGRTLVAASGGVDSTALLLALALASTDLVVAHVLHDIRPRADAEADRDAVRALAERLQLPFAESVVHVTGVRGNKESLARRERYAALSRLAAEHRCPYVATAHHADDQLETLLMALLRGAGPHGLRGIAPTRPLLQQSITLIRPMLHATRAEARRMCELAGIDWREDATNADESRLRAALRSRVIPLLREIRPASPRRAADTAELLRDAAAMIDARVREVFGDDSSWPRDRLRVVPILVLGAGLRRAALRCAGSVGADRLPARLARDAARAIRDTNTDPREFHWPRGVTLHVTAHRVEMYHESRPGPEVR